MLCSEENHKGRSFLDRLFGISSGPGLQPRVWREDPSGMLIPEEVCLSEDLLLDLVQEAILSAYWVGKMVIIGRGGQAILKDKVDVLHIRVEAPLAMRIQRVKENLKQLEHASEATNDLRRKAQDLLNLNSSRYITVCNIDTNFTCCFYNDKGERSDMSGASQISQLIIKYDLGSVAGQVRSALKEAIRLEAAPIGAAKPMIGSSRLGGTPDLPGNFTWPAWKNVPMTFVAQIRLEDIAGFDSARVLPNAGLLVFFYDASQETYGASPDDRGGWQVAFFPAGVKLKMIDFPAALPQNARFSPCALQFKATWTLPASLTQVNSGLTMTDTQVKQYESLLDDFTRSQQTNASQNAPHHQMFGWPDQLQDDMQLQSAMMSQGVTEMTDPREKQAEREKLDWQLLLQVDSDDQSGMRWGSNGMIDYWATTQALQSKAFDKTWLVLQSE